MKIHTLLYLSLVAAACWLAGCKKDDAAQEKADKWIFKRYDDPNVSIVHSVRLSYGQVPEINTSNINFYSLAVDAATKKIYFFKGDSMIYRCNFDFSGEEPVGNAGKTTGYPNDLMVGQSLIRNGKLYRVEMGISQSLVRSDLDGKNREDWEMTPQLVGLRSFAIPSGSGPVYLLEASTKRVYKAAWGQAVDQVVYDLSQDTSVLDCMAIEIFQDKLFIATNNGIYVGSLDGQAPLKRIFTSEAKEINYNALYFNERDQKLYWVSHDPEETAVMHGTPYLYAGNPDGTGAVKLLEGFPAYNLCVY